LGRIKHGHQQFFVQHNGLLEDIQKEKNAVKDRMKPENLHCSVTVYVV
jgi:hypothetical protein